MYTFDKFLNLIFSKTNRIFHIRLFLTLESVILYFFFFFFFFFNRFIPSYESHYFEQQNVHFLKPYSSYLSLLIQNSNIIIYHQEITFNK